MFPFELFFEPDASIAHKFSNSKPSDAFDFLTQLKAVPANNVLYNVYALSAPTQLGGVKQLIGSLVLDGQMVTSNFGDRQLYIRHQDFTEDLKLKPEWVPYGVRYSLGDKCPYEVML